MGARLVPLNEVCRKRSSNLRLKDVINGKEGPYPVYGASGIVGYSRSYQIDQEYVAVVKDGAGVGRVLKCEANSSVLGTLQPIVPADSVNRDYLFSVLETLDLAKYTSGSTIPHIYFKDYGKELIPYLDRAGQNLLAGRFRTINRALGACNSLIERFDLLVKSRFIEMFGDPRQLDTNWPCCTLRDCCVFYAGTGFPTEYQGLSEGDLPFYKVGDISREVQSGRRELGRADNYVSTSIANQLKGKIVPTKTIVFAKIGESLKLNRRAFTSVPSLIDNNVMGIKAHDQRLSDIFLFFVTQSVDLGSLSSSTAVPSVRKSTLEKVSIGLPPLELQQAFSDFVIEVDKLRFDVRQQIEKLETLKQSLMQEYFG